MARAEGLKFVTVQGKRFLKGKKFNLKKFNTDMQIQLAVLPLIRKEMDTNLGKFSSIDKETDMQKMVTALVNSQIPVSMAVEIVLNKSVEKIDFTINFSDFDQTQNQKDQKDDNH
jgi:replication fork clamp-binding protein CrfC